MAIRANDEPRFADAGIFELRQYTHHPGMRDTLVEVFEGHFIDSQEQAGIRVGGLYLDEGDPNRFVWFRGFSDLAQRVEALEAFYFGPVWAKYGRIASNTMIDSSDVLLLQSTHPAHPPLEPASSDESSHGEDRVHVSVYTYSPDGDLEEWLSSDFHRHLEHTLETSVTTWRSHPGPNGFDHLPIRKDNAFVWTASFPDETGRQRALGRLTSAPKWADELAPRLRQVDTQELSLRPTRLSRHPTPTTRPAADAWKGLDPA